MLKIVVLLGGNSPERKVSLVSGVEISKQLRANGYEVIELDPADFTQGHELIQAIHALAPDLVFIGLHGGEGENGILQAMLAGNGLAFTGSDYKASAVAMDKLLSKMIASQAGVPVPAYELLTRPQVLDKQVISFHDMLHKLDGRQQTGRLVIKPVDAGSSVGVHIVASQEEFELALTDAQQYSPRIMLEEYIPGRELTVTVLDDQALPVVEIKPHQGFYDYPNKYSAGNTDYQAPAKLSAAEARTVQNSALEIWKAMICSGYGRIDFRYDGQVFYFLEVNTLPGMTPLSLTPMAAKAIGLSFGELLDRIIITARPDLKL